MLKEQVIRHGHKEKEGGRDSDRKGGNKRYAGKEEGGKDGKKAGGFFKLFKLSLPL